MPRTGVHPSPISISYVVRAEGQLTIPEHGDQTQYVHYDDFPCAAILSTCRTVAAEATSILYQENTIEIDLDSAKAGQSGSIKASTIRKLCSSIFAMSPDTWSTTHRVFRSSGLTSFLRAIGPVNTAAITSLSFYSKDISLVAQCLPIATEVVGRHLPNLHRLGIHINDKNIDLNEIDPLPFRQAFPPFSWVSAVFWQGHAFHPLLSQLEEFMQEIQYLQEFKHEGFKQWFCEDPDEDQDMIREAAGHSKDWNVWSRSALLGNGPRIVWKQR